MLLLTLRVTQIVQVEAIEKGNSQRATETQDKSPYRGHGRSLPEEQEDGVQTQASCGQW